MTSQAPIIEKMIDDSGKARPLWIEYFANLNDGDVGTTWTPAITGLTSTGTPSISGVYYQNAGFTDWVVKIVPATDTSSVAGTTYIDIPFSVVADSPLFAITGNNSASGAVNAAARRAYLPAWTAITSPVTISGRVKN
jgi:hypothetical protein